MKIIKKKLFVPLKADLISGFYFKPGKIKGLIFNRGPR